MTRTPQPPGEGAIMIPSEIVALAASTINQVDPPAWGPAPEDATALIRRVHALRTVPLGRLGVDDLRLLISQDVARETLVPLALGMLRYRPLLEGDHYPGDLLMAVLRLPAGYWPAHPSEYGLLQEALSRVDRNDPEYPVFEDDEFEKAIARFRAGR